MENKVLVPDIWELELHGVADAGVPNQERIYLRAAVEVELGEYFLMTGWQWPDGSALPLPNYHWFGKMKIAEGYWIVVFTGPGEQKITKLTSGEPCVVLHWGKETTLFAPSLPQIVPVLMRIGAVKVGSHIPRQALAQ